MHWKNKVIFKLTELGVPVAQWLEYCVSSAKGCGFNSQEHTYWQKMYNLNKSFWIKASAKCINVNVILRHYIYIVLITYDDHLKCFKNHKRWIKVILSDRSHAPRPRCAPRSPAWRASLSPAPPRCAGPCWSSQPIAWCSSGRPAETGSQGDLQSCASEDPDPYKQCVM